MNMLTTTNRLGSKPDNLSVAFYRFTCGNITNGNFMTGGDIAEGFQLFFRKPGTGGDRLSGDDDIIFII
ncbi:Uncharacterised protein [Raoultella planticola]|uniref:Uncharacterized protein n=1 Tax=Raoultella planticola TaxID=575 RepID=A0A485BBR4_RAOPL|nr:Uncharacterised protein [Raoultella planticola]